jgi:hypothetical protein
MDLLSGALILIALLAGCAFWYLLINLPHPWDDDDWRDK